MKYNRCLRCELNYVTGGEIYCDICKKELAGDCMDSDDFLFEENLCPYCDKNPLLFGEEMCGFCKSKRTKKKKSSI